MSDETKAPAALESEQLARQLSELADSKQADEIVALDMRELVSYTDYLVICTAGNERQAKAIADEVQFRIKKDERVLPVGPVEAIGEAGWVLIDYLDCVLHVFTAEGRARYGLEELWQDAPRLQLSLAGSAAPRTARA